MTQFLHSIFLFLLLLWQVSGLLNVSSHPVSLWKRMIPWIVSMLLLLLLLSTFPKKQALGSELDVLEPLEVLSEVETPTILESSPFTKCSNPLPEAVVKAVCETEPLHCIILSGTLKSKICSCLKTIKEPTTIELDIWTTECSSTN